MSEVDCDDQTTLVLSESSEDPAMANTVENPSAAVKTSFDSKQMQWKEAEYQQRNNAPMMLDKAHVIVSGSGLKQAGDSSREKGGTQKYRGVHSPDRIEIR